MISEFHKRGTDIYIDTSGFFSSNLLEKVGDLSLLFDLKLIDDEKHRKYTGVSNDLILKNLFKCDQMKINTIISIPLIPEINTTKKDIMDFQMIIKSLKNITKVRLLQYHDFAKNKYEKLGVAYKLNNVKKDEEKFSLIRKSFIENGITIL